MQVMYSLVVVYKRANQRKKVRDNVRLACKRYGLMHAEYAVACVAAKNISEAVGVNRVEIDTVYRERWSTWRNGKKTEDAK